MAADVLEIYLADIRRLFNSMDPAPFHERDLDPDRGRLHPSNGPRNCRARVRWRSSSSWERHSAPTTTPQPSSGRSAITSSAGRQRLAVTCGDLLRMGRYSLLAALLFLGPVIVIAESAAHMVQTERYAALIENSLVIGAWVALWRPLEIFLYDWWPIRAEARLFDRLSQMDVRTVTAQPAERDGVDGPQA